MIGQSAFELAFGATFTLLMIVAAWLDLQYRRIPNALVFATLVLGAVFATASLGPRDASVHAVEGVGMGLVVWLPFWAVGMIGAGDVKFFAAACAWLGWRLSLDAAIISAVLGGVLALSWMLWRVAATGRRDESDESDGGRETGKRSVTLPYAVAMAAGLSVTAWFPHLIH